MARVLGVDACPAGWVGVLLDDDRAGPRVRVSASFAALCAGAGPLDLVGVDMPIGLPDTTRRAADVLVQAQLGPRRSSLFVTPLRAALAEETHARATAVNRERAGWGISVQAFHLRPKLREVEQVAFSHAYPVVEVHPELSFSRLAGAPLAASKKTAAGVRARRAALRAAGIVLRRPDRVAPRVGVDDVLDAAVVAWSARRVVAGTAECFPDPPEVFSDGWPAAIRV